MLTYTSLLQTTNNHYSRDLILGEAVDRWIRHHFSRVKRAKCFILVGPTGTGKTSFALSLPGRVNYFKERWNLEKWSDYARYSVYDDVPWDDFAKLNYPNKKGLLTQNGKMNVRNHYSLIFFGEEYCIVNFRKSLGNGQISWYTRNQCSTTGHCSFES